MTEGPQIETISGLVFDYDSPTADMIVAGDVAAALSKVCRFGGHIDHFYSVAEHSCRVAALVREIADKEITLAALWHDAHEAFIGDVPAPLKPLFNPALKKLADKIDVAIAERLGIDPALFKHDIIKAADRQALGYEAAILKPSGGAQADGIYRKVPIEEVPDQWLTLGWSPAYAAMQFNAGHWALT